LIDLRSDTVTHPTQAMLDAMVKAELGDDGWGDDPTLNLLQETAADLLGKESAVFVPSGTMGNLASVMAHCQRGDEMIVGDQSHLYVYEYGSPSALGGISVRQVPVEDDGTLDINLIEDAIRPNLARYPSTRLICLENTHNRCSGSVLTPGYTDLVADIAHRSGASLHIDGARIFNAAVYLGVPVKDLARSADSITFCFSKGLCCPIGSMICGSREFVDRARQIRNSLGGGMRQVGLLASAAMVGLNTMVDRLAEDHSNASRLASGLNEINGVFIDPTRIQTNIVIFDLINRDVSGFLQEIGKLDLLASHPYGTKVRMVTHHGVTAEDIDEALDIVGVVCSRR
jgi:threonine aldolase